MQSNIFPYMCYQDAQAAIDWLTRALGFVAEQVHPGKDGSVGHAVLRFGSGRLMLSSVRAAESGVGLKSPKALGGTSQGVYFHLTEVDAHYQRALHAGAAVVRPIEDMDYGSREYTVRDPEGHLWSFGTYFPEQQK